MSFTEEHQETDWWVYFIVAIILILLIIFFTQPYFEMKTFNKFRKPDQTKATYTDALFSNLRITSE